MSKKGPPPEHELAANEANFLWEKLVIVLHELNQSDRTKAYNFMVTRKWNKDLLRLIWEDIEHLDRDLSRGDTPL